MNLNTVKVIALNTSNLITSNLIMSLLSPCIVENGYNTCYLSSLFTAMFYKSSEIEKILDRAPKDGSGLFLQELIKIKFVEPIRRHFSISSNIMNEIRNYCIVLGWCNETPNITEQQDIDKYYKFLFDEFNLTHIEFEILKLSPDLKLNVSTVLKFPMIKLEFNSLNSQSIKNMFLNFITNEVLKNDQSTYYKLISIPNYIPIYINRFDKLGNYVEEQIDIMQRIMFFNINDSIQKNMRWKIHSIICQEGITKNSLHYYTVCYADKKWILFNDRVVPSIKHININDDDIKIKIQKECVLLFYVID